MSQCNLMWSQRSPCCSGVSPLPPRSQLLQGTRPMPWHTMHLLRSMMLPLTELRPRPLQPGHVRRPLFPHTSHLSTFFFPATHLPILGSLPAPPLLLPPLKRSPRKLNIATSLGGVSIASPQGSNVLPPETLQSNPMGLVSKK